MEPVPHGAANGGAVADLLVQSSSHPPEVGVPGVTIGPGHPVKGQEFLKPSLDPGHRLTGEGISLGPLMEEVGQADTLDEEVPPPAA